MLSGLSGMSGMSGMVDNYIIKKINYFPYLTPNGRSVAGHPIRLTVIGTPPISNCVPGNTSDPTDPVSI